MFRNNNEIIIKSYSAGSTNIIKDRKIISSNVNKFVSCGTQALAVRSAVAWGKTSDSRLQIQSNRDYYHKFFVLLRKVDKHVTYNTCKSNKIHITSTRLQSNQHYTLSNQTEDPKSVNPPTFNQWSPIRGFEAYIDKHSSALGVVNPSYTISELETNKHNRRLLVYT